MPDTSINSINSPGNIEELKKDLTPGLFEIEVPKQNQKVLLFESLFDSSLNPVKMQQTAYLILRGITKQYPEQEIIPNFSLQVCEYAVHFGYFYEYVANIRQYFLEHQVIIEFIDSLGSTKYKITPFFHDLYEHLCGTRISKDNIFSAQDLRILVTLKRLKIPIAKVAKFYNCSTNTISYWLQKVRKKDFDCFSNVAGALADLEALELEKKKETDIMVSPEAVMRRMTFVYDKMIMLINQGSIHAIKIKDFVLLHKEYIKTMDWYTTKKKLNELDLEEFMDPEELNNIIQQSFKTLDKHDIVNALPLKDPKAKELILQSLSAYDNEEETSQIDQAINAEIQALEQASLKRKETEDDELSVRF